jgi:hypothetical protein
MKQRTTGIFLLMLVGSPSKCTHSKENFKAIRLAAGAMDKPKSLSFQINYVLRLAGHIEILNFNDDDTLRSFD